jgi:hypothetical protein
MRILMLDTKTEVELDEIEAVCRIQAGMAVEALGSPARAESTMLDRSTSTAMKPPPRPLRRPIEKRRKAR